MKKITAAAASALLLVTLSAGPAAAAGPINPGAWLMCKISKSFC